MTTVGREGCGSVRAISLVTRYSHSRW